MNRLFTFGCSFTNFFWPTWADISVYYDLDDQIIDLYQDDLYTIRSSIYETVFDSDWYSRPGYCDLSAYENAYENLKGGDWPSITDFVNQNFTGIKNLSLTMRDFKS